MTRESLTKISHRLCPVICGLVFFFLVLAPSYGQNAPTDFPINGIFSNMSMSDEDVTGMEIFILGSRNGYYALIQCAAGEPQVPFVSKVNVQGQKVSILVPKEHASICDASKLSGTVTKKGLDLVINGNKRHIKLERGRSFWIE